MKNLIFNHKFKTILILLILFCLYIFINAYSYVSKASSDLSKNVLRLHVIANSDSVEDQNLKYEVRDNLIEYMNTICSDMTSKSEAMEMVSNHISDFTNIANKTISENGFPYSAKVELGNFEFPTKTYADVSFPAGYYDALEVKLGNSSGQNWWCVLYPSLCFIDKTSSKLSDKSKEELQENLSNEEYALISNTNDSSLNFKFRLIELFNKAKLFTAQK